MKYNQYLLFLGSATPCIVNRVANPSERHLLRVGFEKVSEMAGCFQVYYLKGLYVPLKKMEMEVSVFLNKLSRAFKCWLGKEPDDEVWVYYRDHPNGVTKRL